MPRWSTRSAASPVVLDPHPERLAAGARFGASRAVLATRTSRDVARGGRGADLVIEAVGRVESWELAVAMAAPGGVVNLFGGCARGRSFTVPTARVHYEEVTIMGTYHHAPRYIAEALRILAQSYVPLCSRSGRPSTSSSSRTPSPAVSTSRGRRSTRLLHKDDRLSGY